MAVELDKIYNEDCLFRLSQLPDECIDLVVTDCPYRLSSGGDSSNKHTPRGVLSKKRTKHISLSGVLNDQDPAAYVRNGKLFEYNNIKFNVWLPEIYRVLKPNTHCYIMINGRNLKDLQIAAEQAGFVFQNLLVWRKQNATPSRFYMQQVEFILMLRKGGERWINDMGTTTCLSVPNIIGRKLHPTEKPVALMRVLIENSSVSGDIVLDPFIGSGTTAIACIQADRHYIGCEIDPKYYNIATRRIKAESIQTRLF